VGKDGWALFGAADASDILVRVADMAVLSFAEYY